MKVRVTGVFEKKSFSYGANAPAAIANKPAYDWLLEVVDAATGAPIEKAQNGFPKGIKFSTMTQKKNGQVVDFHPGEEFEVTMKGTSWTVTDADGNAREFLDVKREQGGSSGGGSGTTRAAAGATSGGGGGGGSQPAGTPVTRLPTPRFFSVSAELVVLSFVSLVTATRSKKKVQVVGDDGSLVETTLGEAFKALEVPLDTSALWEIAGNHGYGASLGLNLQCISSAQAMAMATDAQKAAEAERKKRDEVGKILSDATAAANIGEPARALGLLATITDAPEDMRAEINALREDATKKKEAAEKVVSQGTFVMPDGDIPF